MLVWYIVVFFWCECYEFELYMFFYYIFDMEGVWDLCFWIKSCVFWWYWYSMKVWWWMNEIFGSLFEDVFFGVDGWYIYLFMCNYVEYWGCWRVFLNDFVYGLGSCLLWMNESMGGWIYDLVGWMIILIF